MISSVWPFKLLNNKHKFVQKFAKKNTRLSSSESQPKKVAFVVVVIVVLVIIVVFVVVGAVVVIILSHKNLTSKFGQN